MNKSLLRTLLLFSAVLLITFASFSTSGFWWSQSDADDKLTYTKAYNAYVNSHYEKALQTLSAIGRQADPHFQARILFLTAKAYSQLGDTGKAIDCYSRIEQLQLPLADVILYEKARMHLLSQDNNNAAQCFSSLVTMYPSSSFAANALLNLADISRTDGRHSEALEHYMSLLSRPLRKEQQEEALLQIAAIHEQQGNIPLAYQAYIKMIASCPDSSRRQQVLHKIELLSGQLQNKQLPDADDLYAGGKYLHQQGRYRESTEQLKELLNCYPATINAPDALRLIAINRFLYRDYSASLLTIKEFLSSYPGHAMYDDMLYYNAKALYYTGSTAQAIALYQSIAEQFPGKESAAKSLYNLAIHSEEANNQNLMLRYYTRLYSEHPSSTLADDAVWSTGYYYYSRNDYKNAYSTWIKARTLTCSDDLTAKCIYWAAKSADKMGDHTAAFDAYSHVYQAYPDSFYAYRVWETFASQYERRQVLVSSRGHTPYVQELKELQSPESFRMSLLLDFFYDAEAHDESIVSYNDTATSDKWLQYKLLLSSRNLRQGKIYDGIKEIENEVQRRFLKRLEVPRVALEYSYPKAYWSVIEKAARDHNVDPLLICALIREESRFNPKALSRSRAMGLMQIMPATGSDIARQLRLKEYSTAKLHYPELNIEMGTYFFSRLMGNFDNNVVLALAGYNGGPRNSYQWWNSKTTDDLDEFIEQIPFSETRNYVMKVLRSYWMYKKIYS